MVEEQNLTDLNLAPDTAVSGETRAVETVEGVCLRWGLKITLRDGVRLNATLYQPLRHPERLPCVFTLTPYIAQRTHERGIYFAGQGYAFLAIDVRGRGNSEGEFMPFRAEAQDGPDVVRWLRGQPFCNGKVAMWGISYGGLSQWATAKAPPAGLVTIVPGSSPRAGFDFPFLKGIFYTFTVQWLTFTAGKAAQEKIFDDSAFWTQAFRRWLLSGVPFKNLDSVIGNPSPIFQDWIRHPKPDSWWEEVLPSASELSRLDLPVLTITGSYDGAQPGALAYYREHMQYGSAECKANHYLIIGPWDHGGVANPTTSHAGVEFGPAALLDVDRLHKEWYDWTMKEGGKPVFLKDRVAYYVVGENTWRYAPSLGAITLEEQTWHLDSLGGRASDVFASGELRRTAANGLEPDRYKYDPLDLEWMAYESRDSWWIEFSSQCAALQSSGKQLVYHSPNLQADLTIGGFIRLSVWLTLDQPDTDIKAAVYEITEDGRSILLSRDLLRARYRGGIQREVLVVPGAIGRYDFTGFPFIARRICRRSRLRLVIGPVNSMTFERNCNSGGVVAEESAADARTVTVALHHDADHPSALYIPIAAPTSCGGA